MSLPYVLADADTTVVARSWAELTDGAIDTPIHIDETGGDQTGVATNLVLTGTDPSGAPAGSDCGGWFSNSAPDDFTGGTLTATGSDWTLERVHHLYWFPAPALLFRAVARTY